MLVERNRQHDRGILNDISRHGEIHRAQGNGSLLSPCFDIDGLRRYGLGWTGGEIADSHCGSVGANRATEVTLGTEERD